MTSQAEKAAEQAAALSEKAVKASAMAESSAQGAIALSEKAVLMAEKLSERIEQNMQLVGGNTCSHWLEVMLCCSSGLLCRCTINGNVGVAVGCYRACKCL